MLQSFIKIVSNASIELSAMELTVLMIVISVCLATRHNRIGLVATYIFAYKWGWSVFAGHSLSYLTGYLFFGVVTGILTVIALMTDKHD